MNENIITVAGNVIADPESRQTRSGAAMVTFRVASNHRYFNNRSGMWEEGVTNYYDVVAYRGLAHNAGKSLHKGDAVFIQGQFRQRLYTRRDGSTGMGCEIEARIIGPDLTHGVANWMRVPKGGSSQQVGGGSAQATGTVGTVNTTTGEITTPDPRQVSYSVDKNDDPRVDFPAQDVGDYPDYDDAGDGYASDSGDAYASDSGDAYAADTDESEAADAHAEDQELVSQGA